MRFACWIIKATDTHTGYVILIAFPRQQRLCERVSILRYIYIACLLSNKHFPLRPTPIPNTTKLTTLKPYSWGSDSGRWNFQSYGKRRCVTGSFCFQSQDEGSTSSETSAVLSHWKSLTPTNTGIFRFVLIWCHLSRFRLEVLQSSQYCVSIFVIQLGVCVII